MVESKKEAKGWAEKEVGRVMGSSHIDYVKGKEPPDLLKIAKARAHGDNQCAQLIGRYLYRAPSSPFRVGNWGASLDRILAFLIFIASFFSR